MFDLRKRLFFFLPMVVAALLQHTIHEATHYVTALLMNEEVLEFRFMTNGFLTSQVIYATPVEARSGPHWLLIAWSPAVVTVAIGLVLFLTRRRWLTRYPMLNAGLWFATAYFLVVDPFYYAVLAPFFGAGDVGAADAVGWPRWPVHLTAGLICVGTGYLVYRLKQESNREPERYLPPRRTEVTAG